MNMLLDKISEFGFDNISAINTKDISFKPELLEFCKMNSCGNYGKCYTCPPHIGEVTTLIDNAQNYNKTIVFQKIYQIEDSFDIEGMFRGNKEFTDLTDQVFSFCKTLDIDFILLGAGGCRKCSPCAIVNNRPCPNPQNVYPSLESYGIDVSFLSKVAGMNYINGQNTTTFFGAIFIK